MTTADIDIPATPAARAADFIGQATAVEQARAVAEVQAAIVVAQQCPRSVQQAVAQMREACSQRALAERAFFRYPRAGETVTGPSVHFARELARCWGNIQYGIAELRRDDEAGESEMVAFAWDVQTNTRSSNTFVVPHRRDTKKGVKTLTDMRDIYENNANNGARRVREAIFAVLPVWFTEEAKDRCNATIEKGGDKPLAQRIADALKAFEGHGVTVDQLEQKLGRKSEKWTAHDVAQLIVTFTSLQRGEITVDEEFPTQRVTADEILGHSDNGVSHARGVTQAQLRKIQATYRDHGVNDRDVRLADISEIVGRDVLSTNDLSADEAKLVIDALERREPELPIGGEE